MSTERVKPSAASLEGGATVTTETPEPTRRETLLDSYRSRTFRGSEVIGALPSPRWLVRGWLLADSLAAIYGQKGQGKTHYALAMALEIARGGEWAGRRLRPAPVLYLVGEGSSSAVERLEAWQKRNASPLPNLFFSTHPEKTPQLTDGDAVAAFCDLVREKFAESQFPRGGVIFLDTFQTTTVGLDEIAGKEMSVAVEALQDLRKDTGSTVVIVHHAGKVIERGQRGHSSLGAAMETEIQVEKKEASLDVSAKLVKMRAAPDGVERSYRLELVTLEPTDEDRLEALEFGTLPDLRTVPVLTETEAAGTPLRSRFEELLVEVLDGFDLPDGLKRSDAEKVLALGKSQAGNVLKEMRERGLLTNLSPHTGRSNASAYWLTDLGRSTALQVREREVRAKVEAATK